MPRAQPLRVEVELTIFSKYFRPPLPPSCSDTTPPSVNVTTTSASINSDDPVYVEIDFSETVQAFVAADLALSGPVSLTGISPSGAASSYTATLNVTGDGQVSVSVPAGTTQDLSTNGNSASATLSFEADGTPPQLSLSRDDGDSSGFSNSGALLIDLAATEVVTGLDASDLVVSNGAVSGFNSSDGAADADAFYFYVVPSAEGEVVVRVPADECEDLATNPSLGSNTLSYVYDTTEPEVDITAPDAPASGYVNYATVPLLIEFDEPVVDFSSSSLSVSGGATLSGFAANSTSRYEVDLVAQSEGAFSVSLPEGSMLSPAVTDRAQNFVVASSTLDFVYDTTSPEIEIEIVNMRSYDGVKTADDTVEVFISASEDVQGLASADVSLNGTATASDMSPASGFARNFSVTITPGAQGVALVSLGAEVGEDRAQNPTTAAPGELEFEYDTVAPQVSLSASEPEHFRVSPLAVSLSFSEPVYNLSAGHLEVEGASSVQVTSEDSGAGEKYSVELVPEGESDTGALSFRVPAGAAFDGAYNDNQASSELEFRFDTTQPSANLSSSNAYHTNVSPIAVAVAGSEILLGLNVSALSVSGGEPTAFSEGDAGEDFSYQITPEHEGAVSASLAAGAGTDRAGNDLLETATISWVFDTTRPVATLEHALGTLDESDGTVSLTTTEIQFTIEWDSTLAGDLQSSDLVLDGATLANFTGSGTEYAVELTATAGEGNAVYASVAAGAVTDLATNANEESNTLVFTYDTSQPFVTFDTSGVDTHSQSGDPIVTNNYPIEVPLEANEYVVGLAVGDFYVEGGVAAALYTNSSSARYRIDFELEIEPSQQGAVLAFLPADSLLDLSDNSNPASANLSFVFDTVAPSVTLSSTTPSATQSAAIGITLNATEVLYGLEATDVHVVNGTITGFASQSGGDDDDVYSFTLVPDDETDVYVHLPAGAAQDEGTNDCRVSNTLHFIYDTSHVVATLSTEYEWNNAEPVEVVIQFNEFVTGLGVDDLSLSVEADPRFPEHGTPNASFSNFQVVTGSGVPTRATVDVDLTGDGRVTVSMGSDAARDAADNPSLAATDLTFYYDTVRPTVVANTSVAEHSTSFNFPCNVSFNEDMVGFSASDVHTTNAYVEDFVQLSPSEYSFVIDPIVNGDVYAHLPASVATDEAGNPNEISNTLYWRFDLEQPVSNITTDAASHVNYNALAFELAFTKAVYGLTADAITVSDSQGALNDEITLQGDEGDDTFYVNVTVRAEGTFSIQVEEGQGATDIAGNPVEDSNLIEIVYDTTHPAPELSSTAESSTRVAPIPITVDFGEDVTGFSVGDLSVDGGSPVSISGTGGDSSYIVNVMPSGEGNLTVSVAADVAEDLALNSNLDDTGSIAFIFDTTQPAATVSASGVPAVTNESPIYVTVEFSEEVDALLLTDEAALKDALVTGGTVTAISRGAPMTSFVATVVPDEGDVYFSLPAAAFEDAAENTNTASNTLYFVYDETRPYPNISSTQSCGTAACDGSTRVSPIVVDIELEESVVLNDACAQITVLLDGEALCGNHSTAVAITSGSPAPAPARRARSLLAGLGGGGGIAGSVAIWDERAASSIGAVPGVPPLASAQALCDGLSSQLCGAASSSFAPARRGLLSATTPPPPPPPDYDPAGHDFFELRITPPVEGDYQVFIEAGATTDFAGNDNLASSTLSFTFDTTRPNVTAGVASGDAPDVYYWDHDGRHYLNFSPVGISLESSEPLYGLAAADFEAGLSGVAADVLDFAGADGDAAYGVSLNFTAEGVTALQLAAGAAEDAAANDNLLMAAFEFVFGA